MITAAPRRAGLAVLVALAVIWVALPEGGAGSWGRMTARLAAFAALALAAVAYDGKPRLGRVSWVLWALVSLAAFGLVQSLPWPEPAIRLLSPRHAELAADAGELLGAAGDDARATLSLAPRLSRSAALDLTAAASFFFAAFVTGASRRRRRWLAMALVGGGVIQILLGLRDWLAGVSPRLNGTFVNPNHLAYALEIALAVAFAWSAWAAYSLRYTERLERRLTLFLPPAIAWIALAAGLLATGSRAGLAAAAAGLALQCFLLPPAIRGAGRGVAAQALAAALLAVIALFAVRGAGRLAETTLYEIGWGERAAVWRQSVELWRGFALTGTGLGTFGEAFPMVQPAATTELYWRRAHNDPLELLVTGGLIGLALGAVAAVALAGGLLRVLHRGFRTEDRLGALAALGAGFSIAIHELMDFGLTLPGIALPFAALVGAAAAARVRTRSRADEPGPAAAGDARRAGSPAGGAPPG